MMIERPRVKPHLSVEIVEPQHVFLLDETRAYILDGRAYCKIAPLLDGTRTIGDIIDAIGGEVPPNELIFALNALERRGYTTDGTEDGTGPSAAYWSRLDLSPAAVAGTFARSSVRVLAAGDADAGAMETALRSLDLGTPLLAAGDDQAAMTVVVADDYLDPSLAAVNASSLASGRPWMLVKLTGTTPWVGPIFRPGHTACWECLQAVLSRNRHVEAFVERQTGQMVMTSKAALPASIGIAASLAATELARWLAVGTSSREQSILTLDLLTHDIREHAVRRRAHCPACSPAEDRVAKAPPPLTLESRLKRFTHDGGHRAVTPEETWQRLTPLVSPITGVVTSLLRKDDTENGLTYSYASGHDFVSSDLAAVQQNMRYRSGGKGMSDLQARVSGACEAVERYSGVWRGTEYVVRRSRMSLGDDAIDLNDVLLFSEAQFQARKRWNAACSPTQYHVVPEPFDDSAEIDWTPYWSLTHGRTRYLPSAFSYYGHPDARKFFCATDANGTAAGNTIEEAILQGLFELVERDAVAVWWYNRLARPALDLDSFDVPYVRALQNHYQSLGREIWVLDLTHDLGVPVFAGVSRRMDAPTEDVIISFGAHFDPAIALTRALTETNQFLPALSRTRADKTTNYMYGDPDAVVWWKTATVQTDSYVAPDPTAPLRRRDDFASLASLDLKVDVEQLVQRLANARLEVVVLDQTRRDVGFPVVKVIVPGLRHFWRRLAPGRLYDVPVQMGWLQAPRAEGDLNPVSMFF